MDNRQVLELAELFHRHQFIRVAGLWYCPKCNSAQRGMPHESEIGKRVEG